MKVHFEPYVYLAGLTHKSRSSPGAASTSRWPRVEGGFRLVDDSDLDTVHPPRRSSIGASSDPYGQALVEVRDEAGTVVATGKTATANHVWVAGLEPDRVYSYRVLVNGQEWAGGPRRDWELGDGPRLQGLVESGASYDNRFRTHPHPDADADLWRWP
jgi:hypothetical protein